MRDNASTFHSTHPPGKREYLPGVLHLMRESASTFHAHPRENVSTFQVFYT